MRIGSIVAGLGSAMALLGTPAGVFAQEVLGELESVGKPWAKGVAFQPAVTEIARDIHWLDNMLLIVITLITLFVTALIAWVVIRYNAKSNPNAGTFTHNSVIEVIWTVVPIVILIVIGAFSLPALFKQLEVPEPDLTIKATGYQWYWGYEYPDSEFAFDSYMLARDELAEYGYADDEFLLATDTAVVVPVGAVVKMQVTGGDVIHSWKIPAFGVHIDAVPGRLNETWFKVEREGIYFGQCSELCGKDHSYMPITVKAVSQEKYDAWLEEAVEEFAGTMPAITVASAD